MTIYISGALKGSNDLEVARAKYELVAECLRSSGLNPYVPHQFTDPELNGDVAPSAIFATDIRKIEQAESAVIFLDESSLGVGIEISLFVDRAIPILALCREGADPSRFAVGYLEANGIALTRYSTDLCDVVRDWVQTKFMQVAV